MFRLLRFYSITSLLAIGFTGLLLVFLYRHESSQTITNMGEINNLALANTVLNAVRPQLVDYLVAVAHEPPQPATTLPPIPHALEAAIKDLMRDNSVVRIKIYNRVGTVVHSTRPGQTGMAQNEHEGEVNLGFMSAIRGQVADALIYRDSFNSFDGVTEEDNLMQTYIPVRDGVDGPIRGVFEIYTDVNPQVIENERILFKMLAGAAVILTILYATLYLLVRRADRIIEGQRRTILERSETIEQLSAKLLGSEESRRKQIAYDLHEGVAQTLSAIKMTIEGSLLDGQEQRRRTGENVIPILRDAIQEVRTMATRLRPSSLDDLGLLPTIEWYCRELGKQFDGVKASSSISFRESDIPAHLKIIIYRVIDFVSLAMAESDPKAKISIALRRDGEDLTLSLEHEPSPGWRATELPVVSEAEERTTLSGGSFYAGHNLSGGMSVRAAWAVKWDWPASTADSAAVVHLGTAVRQGNSDISLASGRRQSLAR